MLSIVLTLPAFRHCAAIRCKCAIDQLQCKAAYRTTQDAIWRSQLRPIIWISNCSVGPADGKLLPNVSSINCSHSSAPTVGDRLILIFWGSLTPNRTCPINARLDYEAKSAERITPMVGNYIFETHFGAPIYWFAAVGLAFVFGRARCLSSLVKSHANLDVDIIISRYS
jgi:hypothetical protein